MHHSTRTTFLGLAIVTTIAVACSSGSSSGPGGSRDPDPARPPDRADECVEAGGEFGDVDCDPPPPPPDAGMGELPCGTEFDRDCEGEDPATPPEQPMIPTGEDRRP